MKRMKCAILFAVLLVLLTSPASGHPGKTDRYGGHKCLKGCGAWGLSYEEYHLHDKDMRPIRVSQRKKNRAVGAIASDSASTRETTSVMELAVTTQVVTTNIIVRNVVEENVVPIDPFLFVLLVLLLLLLILRMNRKREEARGRK